jgi:hypothetical protein
MLADKILAWPQVKFGCDIHALQQHLSAESRRIIPVSEVESAINFLVVRELIKREGDKIWLSEPDRKEFELYGPLEGLFKSPSLLRELGVQDSRFVFQRTATVGSHGDGALTRPDFTLAAIHSWKFDPARTLEVFSFEVKNRNGAGISAVYEAVAHGRLVHHPYLVCPLSRLNAETHEAIRTACEEWVWV